MSAFPGGTAVTRLRVYDWAGPDGLPGGSAHVHLLCTEGYAVVGGTGRLQTLSHAGFSERPLCEGDVVWFTPGTIHRLINERDLDILVVMQNGGLPEAGDAVLAFPPDVLGDPARYASAAALADGTHVYASGLDAARRRKDLAVEGFLALRERFEAEGPSALDGFYQAALRLVRARLDEWERRWRTGAAAVAEETGRQLAALRAGDPAHLRAAAVSSAKGSADERLGMCGRLTTYDG